MAGVVLIVDEDLALLKRLHAFLREKNVDCCPTQDLDTTLAAFSVTRIDLVIADRALCEPRGWELGRALREVTGAPIVLTAAGPLDDELGDKRLIDACAVLYKPYDEERFWSVIVPILDRLEGRIEVQ